MPFAVVRALDLAGRLAKSKAAAAGPKKFLPLSLLSLLFSSAPLHAAFSDIGAGARAPGMGNVFTAVADDVYAIYYNPAGLALLDRPEFSTSYTRLLLGFQDNSSLSSSFGGYAHPLQNGRGTIGGSWQLFSLNTSLYRENTFTFAYGKLIAKDFGRGDLYGGVSAKYLQRSFGTSPEASNSLSGLGTTGTADPILTGKKSVGVPDADVGLLYRLKEHYAVGLALFHVARPNVAFDRSNKDELPMIVRGGINYRSLLSNVGVELETQRTPLGTQDQKISIGGERWYPRLFVGDFGLRGSLGLGSRDFKQASMGFSYRTRRIEVDYGFSLPINSIASSAGTHRIGFSLRFGSLKEADESVEMVLEAMRKIKAGAVPEIRVAGKELAPSQRVLMDEYLAQAEMLQAQAQYRASMDRFSQALTVSPADPQLLKNFGRLNFVSQLVKELPGYKTEPAEAALHQGVLAYLAGNNGLAVEKASYALSLKPSDKVTEGFLSQLELTTGLKRPEVAKVEPARYQLEQMLIRASAALEDGRYDDAIQLSLKVLQEDEKTLAAWENLGTAYFAIGAYSDSLKAWEKAYSLEKNPARRSVLRGTLASVRNVLNRPKPAMRPVAVKERVTASPKELQALYNQGVDYYTSGQLDEAKKTFEKLLELDPDQVPAAKALRRVKEEMSPR